MSSQEAAGRADAAGAGRAQAPAAPEVSVVLPCRNEAATVARCVRTARDALAARAIDGEVVVVDNASTDDSAALAEAAGARVVVEPRVGYGNALLRGIEEARAPYIVMADADDSYDLGDVGRFVDELRRGAELVMGSRRTGRVEPGAMPWHHRWIGNPLLSGLLRLLFRCGVTDAHCGMRGFTREAARRMRLATGGMELASEMVIKAALGGMRIVELPITLRRDGRGGASHLRWFRDGWRHLRFMLLFSPTYLFVVPGLLCMALGILPLAALGGGPRRLGALSFDVHYMVLGSLLTVLGFQIVTTGIFAKVYSHAARLYAPDRLIEVLARHFTLERGLAVGAALFVAGFAIDATILVGWLESGMGSLDAMRPALQASTLMIVGAQTIVGSFFLSMLDLTRREPRV